MDFSKEFKNWLFDMISDALDDYKGVEIYGCDLTLKLFEGENSNGSVSCSSYEAKEFIRQYWDDAGEIFEDWKLNTGESINPFENPESFQVIMLLEGARDVLSQSDFIDEHWNDNFKLTSNVIKTIKNDIGIHYSKSPASCHKEIIGETPLTVSLDNEAKDAYKASMEISQNAQSNPQIEEEVL